jgi:chorismate mutase/prephenate dehydratase
MSTAPDSLAALRREIDSIDDSLHDLLMRRGEIVAEIGRRKASANGALFRPAREAQLLRRLLNRHGGDLPAAMIVRVWREIVAGATRLQGDFTVGYCPFEDHGSALRLTNEQFGIAANPTRFENAGHVVPAVARGEISAGIVPLPHASPMSRWWIDMRDAPDVHVVARVPWYTSNATGAGGFVLARSEPEESGDDRSLVMFTCNEEVSRARIAELLAENDLAADAQTVSDAPDGSGEHMHIADLGGFVAGDDRRLRAVARLLGGADIRLLGAYPAPFGAGA